MAHAVADVLAPLLWMGGCDTAKDSSIRRNVDANDSASPDSTDQYDTEDPTDTADTLDTDRDGFSPDDGDCDDSDHRRFPGATEVCDRVDNDCDGVIDNHLDDCKDQDVSVSAYASWYGSQTYDGVGRRLPRMTEVGESGSVRLAQQLHGSAFMITAIERGAPKVFEDAATVAFPTNNGLKGRDDVQCCGQFAFNSTGSGDWDWVLDSQSYGPSPYTTVIQGNDAGYLGGQSSIDDMWHQTYLSISETFAVWGVDASDLDSDGHDDLLLPRLDTNYWEYGAGEGRSELAVDQGPIVPFDSESGDWMDHTELVIYQDFGWWWSESYWSLQFSDNNAQSFGQYTTAHSDVDGDGLADIVVGSTTDLSIVPTANWNWGDEVWVQDIQVGQVRAAVNIKGVDSGGDLNGDGYQDVIVSEYQSKENSAVRILTGRAEDWPTWGAVGDLPGLQDEGAPGTYSSFGSSAAIIRDFDGDGFDDLAIGQSSFMYALSNSNQEGKAYVCRGGPDGAATRSNDPADCEFSWRGETVHGTSAHGSGLGSVAAAGDINHDGRADLFLGAPNFNGPDADENEAVGKIYLVLGTPL